MQDVAAGETGRLRVVAAGPEGAGDGPAAVAVARLLGLDRVVAGDLVVLDMADLAGLGLTGYLEEGWDVDPAALAADGQALDGLKGRVFVLRSAAFGGHAVRLVPAPGVRIFGPYPEGQGARARTVPPRPEEPVVLVPPQTPAAPAALRLPLALLVVIGLPLAVILFWWLR